MAELGEIYIEFAVVVKSVDTQDPEPENNIPEGGVSVEEVEFYEDGELVTDKKLTLALDEYVNENHRERLDEAAAEAYGEAMRSAEEDRADHEIQMRKDEGFW